MERITLSNSLQMSRIVYGMWRIADDTNISVSHVDAKINRCLDQGITSFDQADIYGGYAGEAIFGAAIKVNPSLRDKMEIVTKCGIVAPIGKYRDKPLKYYDTSAGHINNSVEASLSSMAIDYIDLLLIHRPDPLMDHQETGAALDALVQSGKVGNIGVSNFKPHDWQLLQSAMSNKLVTNQIEFSLSAHEALTNGDIAFHQKNGEHLMAWSPLGGGSLMRTDNKLTKAMDLIAKDNNVDRASVAVAWILAHPLIILPVMGTNNLSRIATLSDALKVKMDRVSWYQIYQLTLGHDVA